MNVIEIDNVVALEDCFKQKFKCYKSKKPKASLHEVISVDHCNIDKVSFITPKNVKEDNRAELLGLRPLAQWKLYSFREHPGLLLIRNPFTNTGQRYWIRKCLEVYPRKPNKLNIDIEMCLQDWWTECFANGQCNRTLQKKLRWTTLGYHHNWDSKVYSDDSKTDFPKDLAELSDVVACYLGCTFKAEAAIVNYYHMDSTLSPHTDHSEVNLEAPLFSFSFGQSAIFLIGGKDKSFDPSAILLDSGDIVIMSKEARLCYHAVPRILPATSTPWNDTNQSSSCKPNQESTDSLMKSNMDESEWSRFGAYIGESRINMNVRQVLNDNQMCLTDFNFNTLE